ncbi:MAG: hemerythrin [Planctomycetes bacterium GWA2_40_7]|nr:MAG: hemerythrin [Planctomycetes bacterium GWA2_40_7]OHB47013.1 MAG: hemerythrin [Planctomycetes bacterium GWF2_40_8]OHB89069.1 MAG: hemerythrin [Planctomycetes bacterium RIFCSPHIGHO2_02_FULL_40_12]OHC02496.1 MAG: hemerythrin [Planctomycetes bacterium RIFCSPLOWO2_12_FULL_40_19]
MTLDVQNIPPRERHPKIFDTFDSLKQGDMMVLINDHDPKPLKYQLDAERTGQLEWKYILTGPEVWKVEILKK